VRRGFLHRVRAGDGAPAAPLVYLPPVLLVVFSCGSGRSARRSSSNRATGSVSRRTHPRSDPKKSLLKSIETVGRIMPDDFTRDRHSFWNQSMHTSFKFLVWRPRSRCPSPASPSARRPSPAPGASEAPEEIVVTAKRLDTARDSIAPSLGASDYIIDRKSIANQPQGVDTAFNQILLQAPGVSQDSFRPAPPAQRARQSAVPDQRRHSA